MQIKKHRFYPSGNGRLSVNIEPAFPRSVNCLDRGSLNKVTIISGASDNLRKAKVSERQASAARELLSSKLDITADMQIEYYDTVSTGSQINIIAEFENSIVGVGGLVCPGKQAERVGRQTAKILLKNIVQRLALINMPVTRYFPSWLCPKKSRSLQHLKSQNTQKQTYG